VNIFEGTDGGNGSEAQDLEDEVWVEIIARQKLEWKKTVCREFQEGRCGRTQCKFSHGIEAHEEVQLEDVSLKNTLVASPPHRSSWITGINDVKVECGNLFYQTNFYDDGNGPCNPEWIEKSELCNLGNLAQELVNEYEMNMLLVDSPPLKHLLPQPDEFVLEEWHYLVGYIALLGVEDTNLPIVGGNSKSTPSDSEGDGPPKRQRDQDEWRSNEGEQQEDRYSGFTTRLQRGALQDLSYIRSQVWGIHRQLTAAISSLTGPAVVYEQEFPVYARNFPASDNELPSTGNNCLAQARGVYEEAVHRRTASNEPLTKYVALATSH